MEIAAGKVFTVATDELAVLLVFLLIGLVLRQLIKPLQKLFLPAGLIGGALALILGPQVLGVIDIPSTWSGMATPMINVVLTCTMFGVALNKSKIKSYAGAIDLILMTYFAQMLVGTLVGIALSVIWPDLPYSWGVMAVFTYWGGHGAATTAGTLFEDMGISGMLSLGIILATLGLIIAMVAGMVVVNLGVRRGWAKHMTGGKSGEAVDNGYIPKERQKSLGAATVSSDAINGLALQLCFVLLSMWLGKVIFTNLAKVPVEPVAAVMSKIPSLLYGIVGAAIVWAVMCKAKLDKYADKEAVGNISGVALEICICSATATLNLKLFADFLAPILIHMVCIIALMSFICIFLVRRWFKKDWFELCLMAFGQGHGSTPSGLALARCVDPDHKAANCWEGFGVALGCVSPITSALAAVLPILAVQSQWIPVLIGLAVTTGCVVFGEVVIRRQN